MHNLKEPSARLTLALLALAFLSPIALVSALSLGPFSAPILPELIIGQAMSEKPVELLASLSQTLLSMSLGLAFGSMWLFRRPVQKRAFFAAIGFLLTALTFSLTSVFAGLRFQYGIAQQLIFSGLDFAAVSHLLLWQAAALSIQLSCACCSATLTYLLGDKRFKE